MRQASKLLLFNPSQYPSEDVLSLLSRLDAHCLMSTDPEGALALATNHICAVTIAFIREYGDGGAQDFDFCRAARSVHPDHPIIVIPVTKGALDSRFRHLMLENRNIVLMHRTEFEDLLPSYMANVVGLEHSTDEQKLVVEELPELDDYIRSNYIRPYYQPIVKLETNEVYGYEALARSEIGGLLNHPGVLFEYAANKSMFASIDYACTEASLRDGRGKMEGKTLFLNVQPRSLTDVDFAEVLHANVVRFGRDPSKVCIELTEQEGVRNFKLFHASLARMRELGFKIAVDDFGEGNANFEMLLHVSPDVVKISGKIINHVQRFPAVQVMLQNFTSLARELNVLTIAEFIETEEQRKLLCELGVDLGQGWHLGRPQAPAEIS